MKTVKTVTLRLSARAATCTFAKVEGLAWSSPSRFFLIEEALLIIFV